MRPNLQEYRRTFRQAREPAELSSPVARAHLSGMDDQNEPVAIETETLSEAWLDTGALAEHADHHSQDITLADAPFGVL